VKNKHRNVLKVSLYEFFINTFYNCSL